MHSPRSLRFGATVLILTSLAGCQQQQAAQAQVAETPRPKADLFVYRGGGCSGRDKLPPFITMLGREPEGIIDFAQTDTWPGMLGSVRWAENCWKGKPYKLAQSVPMLLSQGTTLAEGAAGAYDRHFEEFGRILVAGGNGDAYLRIGWEFNGDWYPWAAAKDPEAFKVYFKRIATIFRRTPGSHFKIVWNPAQGKQQIAPDTVYPGDDAVDIIALDLYNRSWRAGDKADPEVRWRHHVDEPYGLDWLRTFAAQHSKPIALPEWGTGTSPDGQGMGDDPVFITRMGAWIAANNVAFTGYWDYPAPDFNAEISGGKAPKSAKAFRAIFGPGE